MGIDFHAAVRQRKAQTNQRGGQQGLGCQHVHTGLAKIEHDAFDRIASGQTELNGGLYRDANRTAPFATQKSSRSPQTRRGLLGGEGLVQDELRARLQDVAHAAFIAEKSKASTLVVGLTV
jgi:hypothetical protein